MAKQQINSRWRLAWGQVETIKEATWRDERIAVVTDKIQNSSIAISPSGRYVVTGDVWLSDRSKLQQLRDDGLRVNFDRLGGVGSSYLRLVGGDVWVGGVGSGTERVVFRARSIGCEDGLLHNNWSDWVGSIELASVGTISIESIRSDRLTGLFMLCICTRRSDDVARYSRTASW